MSVTAVKDKFRSSLFYLMMYLAYKWLRHHVNQNIYKEQIETDGSKQVSLLFATVAHCNISLMLSKWSYIS